MPLTEDAGSVGLVPAWFAILVVAVPLALSGLVLYIARHTSNAAYYADVKLILDRLGWALLGMAMMAAGLIAWWMLT
jgi:hypothetical protein